MTVCIAALCQNEDEAHAVVAADRMVTMGGFIEFEHAVPKMTATSSLAVAMIAGDALTGTRLAQEAVESLEGSIPPVEEIAQTLAAMYADARNARMTQQIFEPRALNLETYYASHQALSPQIVALLDNLMAQFNLGVELLLAGIDASGAHIYTVMNPGPPENLHDMIGFAAVGSGTIHALQAMIGFGHSPSAGYHETVFRAYAAKRRSEVAPGVGLETDMAVITNEEIHWLTDDEMAQLKEIYEAFEASTSGDLRARLAEFRLGEGGESESSGSSSD
jgi:20S proteasome alpha/beta subunit